MPIKLVALDLDGTLIADWQTIREPVQTAVQAAVQQGVKVVVATGREYGTAATPYEQLGLATPLICFQGALAYEPRSNLVLVEHGLALPLVHQLIDLARAQDLALYVYGRFDGYAENGSQMGNKLFADIGSSISHVADLKQVVTANPLKAIIMHPAEKVPALIEWMAAHLPPDAVTLARSLDVAIEIVAPTTSKGSALAAVAAHYGITQQETMAVGDQDNDVEMLNWAGLSVAMGNGSAKAKAVANYVAPTVEEDGAAWAINQFVLK